jgi:hypothetical protein
VVVATLVQFRVQIWGRSFFPVSELWSLVGGSHFEVGLVLGFSDSLHTRPLCAPVVMIELVIE